MTDSAEMSFPDLTGNFLSRFAENASTLLYEQRDQLSGLTAADMRDIIAKAMNFTFVPTGTQKTSAPKQPKQPKTEKTSSPNKKDSYTTSEMQELSGDRCWRVFSKGANKGNYCGHECVAPDALVDSSNQQNNRCKTCKSKGVKPNRSASSVKKEAKGVRNAVPHDVNAESSDEEDSSQKREAAHEPKVSSGEEDEEPIKKSSPKKETPPKKTKPVDSDEETPAPKKKTKPVDSDEETPAPKKKTKPVDSDED